MRPQASPEPPGLARPWRKQDGLDAIGRIDNAALLRIAGATITVGGRVSAAVIFTVAVVLSWAVSRDLS